MTVDAVEQARLDALAAEERWNEAHVALRAAWKRYDKLYNAQRAALLPQVEAGKKCAACSRQYDAAFVYCPWCGFGPRPPAAREQ
jgi:hypothetical protein